MGRSLPFLIVVNEILTEQEISLPLEDQVTTTLEKGIEAPVEIFEDGMKEACRGSHINRWLAANCFGDYYTRTGLTLA